MMDILQEIEQVIVGRKKNPLPNSYVNRLLKEGPSKIYEKIREESEEVIDASMNKGKADIIWEVADLWFHTLVLLGYHGISVEEITKELERRRK